jgi:hypothetical protein
VYFTPDSSAPVPSKDKTHHPTTHNHHIENSTVSMVAASELFYLNASGCIYQHLCARSVDATAAAKDRGEAAPPLTAAAAAPLTPSLPPRMGE